MINAINKITADLINTLEKKDISFLNYLTTFFFVILLRNFIESYSQETNYLNLSSTQFATNAIHYGLSYITLALLLISLLYCATSVSINKITRCVLPFFIILLMTPLIDLIVTQGQGANIYYLQPGLKESALKIYLTYFGGGFGGASLGLKCEITTALLFVFMYLRTKNISLLPSLFYTWIAYSLIFAWASTPYFIKWFLELIPITYHYSGALMIRAYLLFIFFLITMTFYLHDKQFFISSLKKLNFLKIIYYDLTLLLGAVLGLTIGLGNFFWENNAINLVFCMISVFWGCLFLEFLADTPTNKQINDSFTGAVFILFLSYALAAGAKAFLMMSVFIGCYYIYQMPPLQLKNIPILSPLLASLRPIVLVVLGYVILCDDVYHFPHILFWIYPVAYIALTVSINIKIRKNSYYQTKI